MTHFASVDPKSPFAVAHAAQLQDVDKIRAALPYAMNCFVEMALARCVDQGFTEGAELLQAHLAPSIPAPRVRGP